jgi:hypothetical protein
MMKQGRLTAGERSRCETPVAEPGGRVAPRAQCREQRPIECQHMAHDQGIRSIGGVTCGIGGSDQDRAEHEEDRAENWMFVHDLFPLATFVVQQGYGVAKFGF